MAAHKPASSAAVESSLLDELAKLSVNSSSTDKVFTSASSSTRATSRPRIISVDVEAVASGKSHMSYDRAPCWVALIDDTTKGARPLLDLKMRPPVVVDYLPALSGVTEESLRDAVPMSEGLRQVHALLGPDVTLVGWNLTGDLAWLKLKQGVHYKDTIDCIGWFTHMQRSGPAGKWFLRRYALAHVARCLLGQEVRSNNSHSPVNDALATLRLYEKYKDRQNSLENEIKLVRTTGIIHTHGRVVKATETGVCMSGYDPKHCVCGQPSLRTD